MNLTGSRQHFVWFDSPELRLGDLVRDIPALVEGHRVTILSIDSGPLVPTSEDLRAGWTVSGTVAVSPRVTRWSDLPMEGFDEWYVDVDCPVDFDVHAFINYGGFSLAPTVNVDAEFDPTWDRRGAQAAIDDATNRQEAFWSQLVRLNPVTYLAEGDRLLCATRDSALANSVAEWFDVA